MHAINWLTFDLTYMRRLVLQVSRSQRDELRQTIQQGKALGDFLDLDPREASADQITHAIHATQMYTVYMHLMGSLFLMVVNYFESKLKQLAEDLGSPPPTDLTFADLRGNNDLDRFWKFFVSGHGMDLSEIQNSAWSRLEDMWKIRNRVVHHGQKVSEKDEHLKRYIKRHPHLLIKERGHSIEVFPSFVLDAIDEIETILICINREAGNLTGEEAQEIKKRSANTFKWSKPQQEP